MRLNNHIAQRFLHDVTLAMEIAQTTLPKEYDLCGQKDHPDHELAMEKVAQIVSLVDAKLPPRMKNKNYYVTDSVFDKLEMLKVVKKKTEGYNKPHFDWTVFKNVTNGKRTFIFPDNTLLRIVVEDDTIYLCNLRFQLRDKKVGYGEMAWTIWYVNRIRYQPNEFLDSPDVERFEEKMYKLLCFVYLSENEEVVLQPNQKMGTQKTGKILNELKEPITVISSKWNITSVRNEEFGVRGHFAIRYAGVGRTEVRMVFIEPFVKHGYIRRAKNLSETQSV